MNKPPVIQISYGEEHDSLDDQQYTTYAIDDLGDTEEQERRRTSTYQQTICRSAERASLEARDKSRENEQCADALRSSKTL